MRSVLFAALLLVGCASPNAEGVVTAAPIIAAERAFAARSGEIGWIPAFREYTAPDGQIVTPAGLASAPQSLAETPDDGERGLYWEPAYAGIARSGDLGFTTGPVSFDAERVPRGQYFTVWRRQADGSWKWIFDGGPGPVTEPGPMQAADYAVPSLPVAQSGAGAEAARSQVAALERGAPTASAMTANLASDAHVYRAGRPRAYGGAAAVANMSFPDGVVAYDLVRVESSAAGDLVFTAGDATWRREGQPRTGHFMRIWQYRAEGWRIVYDQLAARPQPPPPPAQN